MNSDVLKGNWKQLRGNLKEAFGKLTDDDLLQAEGSADKMLGALQSRYGYTKDQAQDEWNKFVNKYGNDAEHAKDHVKDAGHHLNAAGEDLKSAAKR